jgi:hypothetical protein
MIVLKIVADVRIGSLISQSEPYYQGVEWQEVKGTRQEAGSFYQCLRKALIEVENVEKFQATLPDHVWVEWAVDDESFTRIT